MNTVRTYVTLVAELLSGGYIESVSAKPYICSPLSVLENATGKQRLVLNLRHVNQFVWKQKFKYEDLRIAMMLFRPGEYMFTFDLKLGYHHVEVTQAHRKYLGFEWNIFSSRCCHLAYRQHRMYSLNLCECWLGAGDLRG